MDGADVDVEPGGACPPRAPPGRTDWASARNLALLLAGSAAGVAQLRVEEAARGGARALARGAAAGEVGDIVRRLAGETAGSELTLDGEWLRVTVSGRVPGAVGTLSPWTLSATAWARDEAPGAAQQPVWDGVSSSAWLGT